LSIIGFDSINFRLKLFDVTAPANPVLEVDTVIPPLATDPFKANVNTYNNGEFVSHPGDSLITLNKFNPPSQQFVTKILYNNSPLNVCDWGFNSFFFQPESDPLGTQDSLKVFEVFFTGTIEYLINKRLIFLKPASGSFANSVIIIDSLFPHIIEFYQSNFTSSTSVTAGAFPYLIEGDFRCPVSIEEYDDELVNIITFPNPTTGVLNISMSGLLCGKDYDLEVIDEIGRSVWKQTIQSKKTFTIPFDEFKKGLYSITLHTSKGRKSVKVLKI